MKAILALIVSGLLGVGIAARGAAAASDATPGPHAGQPLLRSEHVKMLDLVAPEAVTDTATRDGNWSDPHVWKSGRLPDAGANVRIPEGVAVTLDGVQPAALRTVRVDGTLRFATDRDTSLLVDTIVVTPGGRLAIGSPGQPVATGRMARITFADRGPIDATWDPALLSRGLISHGSVTICGAAVTPHVRLAGPVHRGDTTLRLAEAPANWKAGDRIVLTGTSRAPAGKMNKGGGVSEGSGEDEPLEVLNVAGERVTVKPLASGHAGPEDGLVAYVAHLSRNVVLASQNERDPARAGHVMFMHSPDVHLEYAAFERLGRTDKLKRIDDPRPDADGRLAPGTGTNPRGRYAVHFHRAGTVADAWTATPTVLGCAVVNGPGWGYVNHSSRVDFTDNVAFNVTGSAFVTEAGDETGSFRGNLAVRSAGSGEDEDARHKLQDFGHEGDGFWFQGGGVVVEGNVAAGQSGSGFIYFTEGLDQEGMGRARFAVANLWDPAWAGTINHVDHKDPNRVNDPDSVPVIAVPIRSFRDNVAFACGAGFTARFLTPQPARSVLRDSTAWNCSYGVRVRYTTNLDLEHLTLISGPREKPYGAIFGTLEGEQDIHYTNLRVIGWPVGIRVPEVGHHVIDGGYWDNARSILIPTPLARGRLVEIVGDIRFGDPRPGTTDIAGAKDAEHYNIDLEPTFAGLLEGPGGYRDPNVLFAADVTRLGTTTIQGKQLYYAEQAADCVPFKTALDPAARKRLGDPAHSLPAELRDKTNRQMWDRYRLALGGAIAPADAVAVAGIHGLVGSPSTYPLQLRPTVLHATRQQGFQLAAFGDGKQMTVRTEPTDLRDGWNLLSAYADDGVRHTFLVLAGEANAKSGDKQAKPGK